MPSDCENCILTNLFFLGRAISIVTQYDIEYFQKIEQLTGKKMDLYPAEREQVMLLLERVMEASRFASQQLKEKYFKKDNQKGRKKGRNKEDDQTGDNDEEATLLSSIKKRKGKPGKKRKGQ